MINSNDDFNLKLANNFGSNTLSNPEEITESELEGLISNRDKFVSFVIFIAESTNIQDNIKIELILRAVSLNSKKSPDNFWFLIGRKHYPILVKAVVNLTNIDAKDSPQSKSWISFIYSGLSRLENNLIDTDVLVELYNGLPPEFTLKRFIYTAKAIAGVEEVGRELGTQDYNKISEELLRRGILLEDSIMLMRRIHLSKILEKKLTSTGKSIEEILDENNIDSINYKKGLKRY